MVTLCQAWGLDTRYEHRDTAKFALDVLVTMIYSSLFILDNVILYCPYWSHHYYSQLQTIELHCVIRPPFYCSVQEVIAIGRFCIIWPPLHCFCHFCCFHHFPSAASPCPTCLKQASTKQVMVVQSDYHAASLPFEGNSRPNHRRRKMICCGGGGRRTRCAGRGCAPSRAERENFHS